MLQKCSTCEWTNEECITIIETNTQPIYEHGMRGLQRALDEKVKDANKTCRRCINKDVLITLTRGAHVFVDIECLQWKQLATRLGYPDWSGTFTLSEMPTEIQFSDGTYKLIAVIEYVGSDNRKEIGHYITHCHRVTGSWETYDDLNHNKHSIIASARMLLEKKKIAVLFFVKH